MILRTFVEKCRESQLRAIMGQIAQDAWIRGWGGVGGKLDRPQSQLDSYLRNWDWYGGYPGSVKI